VADHRHRRVTDARRKPRFVLVAAPLATLATTAVVGVGVLATEGASVPTAAIDRSGADEATDATTDTSGALAAGELTRTTVSRSADRGDRVQGAVVRAKPSRVDRLLEPAAVTDAVASADTKLWTTTELNLWDAPNQAATQVGGIESGEKVLTTGRSLFGREEIVVDGQARWVTAGYLSDEEPGPAGIGGECTNGTSVASGVSPNIVKVHEAVCAAFPDITTYGTFRSDGEHSQGLAVDIMVSGDEGQQVADFVQANYAALGVNYLIYQQQIWSVDRSSEGWRGMEDRGSVTANHFDHVHVTVY